MSDVTRQFQITASMMTNHPNPGPTPPSPWGWETFGDNEWNT